MALALMIQKSANYWIEMSSIIVLVEMPPMATTRTSTTRSGEHALRWVVLLAAAFVVMPACSEPATSPTGMGGADAGLAGTGGSAGKARGPGGGGKQTAW